MRRGGGTPIALWIVALALVATTLTACGTEPPAGPVYDTIRAALVAKDYGAVYDLLAASEIRRVAAEAARMREDIETMDTDPALEKRLRGLAEVMGLSVEELAALTDRDLFIRGTTSQPPPMLAIWTEAEFLGKPRVEGTRCRQRMRLPGGTWEGEMRLVLEDDAWRLVLR